MPETGQAGAKTAFLKIHGELERVAADHDWPIGFSIGVALFTNAPSNFDEALKIADSLMYRVKQSGKNDVLCQEQAVADGVCRTGLPFRQPSVEINETLLA